MEDFVQLNSTVTAAKDQLLSDLQQIGWHRSLSAPKRMIVDDIITHSKKKKKPGVLEHGFRVKVFSDSVKGLFQLLRISSQWRCSMVIIVNGVHITTSVRGEYDDILTKQSTSFLKTISEGY